MERDSAVSLAYGSLVWASILTWTGGKMVVLGWHKVACSVTFHWQNTEGGNTGFSSSGKLIQSDSQARSLLVPTAPPSKRPPLLHPPHHVTWIGDSRGSDRCLFQTNPNPYIQPREGRAVNVDQETRDEVYPLRWRELNPSLAFDESLSGGRRPSAFC